LGRKKLRPPCNCAHQPLLPPSPKRRITVVAVWVRRRRRPGSASSPSGFPVVVGAAVRGRHHPVATVVRGRRCRPGSSSEQPSLVTSIRSPPSSGVTTVDVEVRRPVPTGVQPVRPS
jgi:hypothetical protein